MKRPNISSCLAAALFLAMGTAAAAQNNPNSFAIARLYIEFNQSGRNDLGFHVVPDGEDWKAFKILNPSERTIFDATGRAAYSDLGLTEIFFEGAEPSLDDVPLATLLALFPEVTYRYIGEQVDGSSSNRVTLSHAIPDGPRVTATVNGDEVVIRWSPVAAPPLGLPNRKIKIVGYQMIVGSFQVTLPAASSSVEVPEEFIAGLAAGSQPFEVLAIDVSGNQTITKGEFELE